MAPPPYAAALPYGMPPPYGMPYSMPAPYGAPAPFGMPMRPGGPLDANMTAVLALLGKEGIQMQVPVAGLTAGHVASRNSLLHAHTVRHCQDTSLVHCMPTGRECCWCIVNVWTSRGKHRCLGGSAVRRRALSSVERILWALCLSCKHARSA